MTTIYRCDGCGREVASGRLPLDGKVPWAVWYRGEVSTHACSECRSEDKLARINERPLLYPLRDKCPCGSWDGRLSPSGGQACVYCLRCGRFRYNAPKSEVARAGHG